MKILLLSILLGIGFFPCLVQADQPSQSRPQFERQAASRGGNNLRLGAHVGIHLSYATTGTVSDEGSTRDTILVGGLLEYRLSPFFFIQPELNYVQKGVNTAPFDFGGSLLHRTVRLNYLEIPLLAKTKLWLSRPNWKLHFLAGPAFALAIARELRTIAGMVDIPLTQRFASSEFSLVFGVGAQYYLTEEVTIFSEVRYQMGITDSDNSDASYHSRGIQFIAGALFNL